MAKLFSIESIDYQVNDQYIESATSLLDTIYKNINNITHTNNREVLKSKEFSAFIELTNKRFNIQLMVNPDYSDYTAAAIWLFHDAFLGFGMYKNLSNDHLTVKDMSEYAALYKKAINTKDNKEGYIDFRKAKVYGYFSKIPAVSAFNFFHLFKYIKMTPAEVLSVVLHEVGHLFVGFEFHHRLATTNIALYDAMQALSKKDYKLVKYILTNEFNIGDLQDKLLSDENVRFDLVGELSSKIASNVSSELLNIYHDYTAVESGADDFACRFMLQKELASAIHKLNKEVDNILNPAGLKYSMVGSMFGFLITLLLLGFVLAVSPVAGSFYLALIATAATLMAIEEKKYDTEYDRVNRMALNLINSIKNSNLPAELVKEQIRNYDLIIKMTEELKQMPHTRDSFYANYIVRKLPFVRKSFQYKEIQQTIEELINNPIFISSHKLKLS